MSSIEETPNRYPLPPILTVGMMVACYLLNKYLPLGWEPDQVTNFMRGTGWMIVGLAIALDVWTFWTFRKNQANVMPHKAASTLLMSGPFAHSRNPIYLANVMLVAGFGFALGSRWFLFGAALLFFLLSEFAIKREERHLEANFPQAWTDYKKIVRRWI